MAASAGKLPHLPWLLCLLVLVLFPSSNLSFHLRTLDIDLRNSGGDVHDLLPEYGFPRGLLPDNVESYSLSDDGAFEIHLWSPCYVQFDQLVYYDRTIRGKLSFGSVADVSGIQAKKLFVWLSVTGIKSNSVSGTIEFFVGALSEKLPADQFEDVPACKSKACENESGTASM